MSYSRHIQCEAFAMEGHRPQQPKPRLVYTDTTQHPYLHHIIRTPSSLIFFKNCEITFAFQEIGLSCCETYSVDATTKKV